MSWWRESDWYDYARLSDDPSVARLTMTAAVHAGHPPASVDVGIQTFAALIATPEVVDAFHRANEDDAYPEWATNSLDVYEATARALISKGLTERQAANRARMVFGSNKIDPTFISHAANMQLWPDELTALADESLAYALCDYARDPVTKADEPWDENEVNRDSKGRFAPEDEAEDGGRIDGYTASGVAYRIEGGAKVKVKVKAKEKQQEKPEEKEQEQEQRDSDEAMLAYAAEQAMEQRKKRAARAQSAHSRNRSARKSRSQAQEQEAQARREASAARVREGEAIQSATKAKAREAAQAKNKAQSMTQNREVDRLKAMEALAAKQLRAQNEKNKAKQQAKQMELEHRHARGAIHPRDNHHIGDRYEIVTDPFEDAGFDQKNLKTVHPGGLHDLGVNLAGVVSARNNLFLDGSSDYPLPLLTDTSRTGEHHVINATEIFQFTHNNIHDALLRNGQHYGESVEQYVQRNPRVLNEADKVLKHYYSGIDDSGYAMVNGSNEDGNAQWALMKLEDIQRMALQSSFGANTTAEVYLVTGTTGSHIEIERAEAQIGRGGNTVWFKKDWEEEEVNRDARGRFAPEGRTASGVAYKVIDGRKYAIQEQPQELKQEQEEADEKARQKRAHEARIARARRAQAAHRRNRATSAQRQASQREAAARASAQRVREREAETPLEMINRQVRERNIENALLRSARMTQNREVERVATKEQVKEKTTAKVAEKTKVEEQAQEQKATPVKQLKMWERFPDSPFRLNGTTSAVAGALLRERKRIEQHGGEGSGDLLIQPGSLRGTKVSSFQPSTGPEPVEYPEETSDLWVAGESISTLVRLMSQHTPMTVEVRGGTGTSRDPFYLGTPREMSEVHQERYGDQVRLIKSAPARHRIVRLPNGGSR